MKNKFSSNNKIWIVLEGLNTSGKTTQGMMLEKYLIDNGISAKYSHVFDTELGTILKKAFLSDKNLSVMVEVAILYATRFHYYSRCVEFETEYEVLITDRFTDSINSIQGGMQGCDKELLTALDKYLNSNSVPRVNILLDIEPMCIEKRTANLDKDRFEKLPIEMHHNFRNRFLDSFKNKNNYHIVDGNIEISEVHKNIRTIVMDEISKLNDQEDGYVIDIHQCKRNLIMDENTNI